MANKVYKCSSCGKDIAGLKYSHNGQFYCYDCYQKLLAQLELEKNQRQHLYDYIKSIYGVVEIPIEVINMIEHEVSVGGRKIKGIEYTLYYYYEVEGNRLGNIGNMYFILRDHYENAKKYIMHSKELQARNAAVDLTATTRQIKIKHSDLENVSGRHKNISYKIEDL